MSTLHLRGSIKAGRLSQTYSHALTKAPAYPRENPRLFVADPKQRDTYYENLQVFTKTYRIVSTRVKTVYEEQYSKICPRPRPNFDLFELTELSNLTSEEWDILGPIMFGLEDWRRLDPTGSPSKVYPNSPFHNTKFFKTSGTYLELMRELRLMAYTELKDAPTYLPHYDVLFVPVSKRRAGTSAHLDVHAFGTTATMYTIYPEHPSRYDRQHQGAVFCSHTTMNFQFRRKGQGTLSKGSRPPTYTDIAGY